MPFPIPALLVVFVLSTIVTDLRSRRIPNWLTGAGIVAGVALNTLNFGALGIAQSLAGMSVAIALLSAPFALGGIGGGDVKMMAAVGSFLGPRLVLAALGCGLILGGVFMVIHLGVCGRLGEKCRHTLDMLASAVRARSTMPLMISANDAAAVSLPYSLPLGLGTMVVLVSSGIWRTCFGCF